MAMGVRDTFLQQAGDLLGRLNARMEELNAELGAVRERRLDAWAEGDLSENSAYREAENAEEGIQAELASAAKQISELGVSLAPDYRHSGFVSAGSVVTLQYEDGRERAIMLVPDQFAELEFGRIASGSPVGRELEGKQAGDTVTVVMPQKTSVYKILEVD
jgi:transcription elongation factor GreA